MMMMKLKMIPYQICLIICITLTSKTLAQDLGDQCLKKFNKGKGDFVLDTEDSVNEGAVFLSSPSVSRVKECVSACCNDPNCNLALMETGDAEETIKSCFIFNCFYKQKMVCRFVRKKGFNNYVLTSVFASYLQEYDSSQEDNPPRAKAGQDRVVQPFDIVMLNGIESKDDHKIVEYHWELVSGNTSAIIKKTNLEDQVAVSNLFSGVYKFRLTVTDNAGQSDSAEVTVLVLTPEQSRHHCLVPKKEGPCRGSFPRWHYNAASEKCERFNFGGCKENRNNYLSEEECLKACDKVSVHKMPPSGRIGPLAPSEEECGVPCGPEKFTCANKCCIDKELECDSVKQCSDGSDEEHCEKLDSRFRDLLDLDSKEEKGETASHCTQPPVTGTCRASDTMWHYNPYDRKCHRFNYGGCDGNDNRFRTEDSCVTYCKGVTENDAFASRGIYERIVDDNESVYIAIAVALGLAILILLIVIGYCLLKGKKQRQPRQKYVAANGTHLHPIDDTEKLVYNSTTKPI